MTRPIQLRVLDPAESDPRESWLARNEAVLQLGLAWVRRLLEAQIRFQRGAAPPVAFGADGAAVMTDLRADWLLRQRDSAAPDEPPEVQESRAAFDDARAAMADEGRPCTLDSLARIFGLAQFDLDVLLLTMAPQIDAGLAALYGYVHDRMAICHATRHLIVALLCRQPNDHVPAQQRLEPDAALRRYALIAADGRDVLAPITMDERMIGFIAGRSDGDPRLTSVLLPIATVPIPDRLAAEADALAERMVARQRPAALITGPRRTGQRAIAARVAAGFGLSPVELVPRALPATAAERRVLLSLINREAALGRLCLVVDAAPESVAVEDPSAFLAPIVAREAVGQLDAVVVVLSEDPVPSLGEVAVLRTSPLRRDERLWAWRAALPDQAIADDSLEAIADNFPFGLSRIAELARSLAQGTELDPRTLWNACREHATVRLDGLAQRVEARRGWDDIVLPEAVLADLRAVAAQVRCRATVYGKWGYDALLPRGRGVSALFAGPSGAGKTLAAEVITHELELELYCADLSAVVSKYIGETEKNLKRIFDAAEESGAVLFFDEADALFGKRSEVKDSHDRYANIEISYLLQRIERYSGLAILATNMKSHIDFAFLRRLRYLIDIPFPGFADRQRLWRKAFPPTAPLADIDVDRLAMLEIAGGNIIVIATNAAFLAAAEGSAIAMRHIEQAGRAEFRKLDRMFEMPAALRVRS